MIDYTKKEDDPPFFVVAKDFDAMPDNAPVMAYTAEFDSAGIEYMAIFLSFAISLAILSLLLVLLRIWRGCRRREEGRHVSDGVATRGRRRICLV